MHQKTKNIQKRFDGFLQTPCLWKANTVFDLHQFEIAPVSCKINISLDEKLRLGKYIERFVTFELSQNVSIQIIAENIQIQKEKITLGEIDCLLFKDEKPIHLEIIYKFYVYNPTIGNTELAHCIGPNKKDSLIEKLTKLKEKQLPILHTKECESYLKNLQLSAKEMVQRVYFKAQIFVPYANKKITFSTLNTNCIAGFYINNNELEQFSNSKFYIPEKKDWLIHPHKNVNWSSHKQFKEATLACMSRQFSPLCWLKKENGELEKFFLVWW